MDRCSTQKCLKPDQQCICPSTWCSGCWSAPTGCWRFPRRRASSAATRCLTGSLNRLVFREVGDGKRGAGGGVALLRSPQCGCCSSVQGLQLTSHSCWGLMTERCKSQQQGHFLNSAGLVPNWFWHSNPHCLSHSQLRKIAAQVWIKTCWLQEPQIEHSTWWKVLLSSAVSCPLRSKYFYHDSIKSNPVFWSPETWGTNREKKHERGNCGISFSLSLFLFSRRTLSTHVQAQSQMGRGEEGRWAGREVRGIWVNHLLTKAFGKEH